MTLYRMTASSTTMDSDLPLAIAMVIIVAFGIIMTERIIGFVQVCNIENEQVNPNTKTHF